MTGDLTLDTVETPVGFLDLGRVRANARRVAGYAADHGLAWRPHIKTHKSLEIARIQLDAGAKGLTVATLREAEVMAGLTDDLLLAYPPVGPAKLARLVRLPAGVDLKVALDSAAVLDPLAEAMAGAGRSASVLVEADVGLGRVGVAGPEEVVALARKADESAGVRFGGVLLYPGHVRVPSGDQDAALRAVGDRVEGILTALRDAGLPAGIVSGGSTPTLWRSHELPGLTEIRSGSCIFFDREGIDLGVASHDDLAYSVLATVVSTAVPGQVVVDAGSKALAKEGRGGEGFGFVLDHPEVLVTALSEEHGILDLSASGWRPSIGDRVRLVPNHVCVSVNLQDALVARDGDEVRFVELQGRGRGPWSA